MIYQCQDTFLALGRIVAVSAVKQNRMSGTEEASFQVTMSGANHPMYFRAFERSALATVQLRDDHHCLLAAWHQYRAGRNIGLPSIYDFGNLQLNLLAISAITEMNTATTGNKWAGANAPSTPTYEIFLIGLNEPIKRRLTETGHETVDQLALERDMLLDAWKAFERMEPANQKVI